MQPRHAKLTAEERPVEDSRREAIDRIYREWDEALASKNVERLLACYAPDAILESPLVPHLLGTERGICEGHAELRRLFEILGQRKPKFRQHFRTHYFTDGKKMIFEYPRSSPKGEQMDFVEVMEINDAGLIQHHSVYWGWFGVRVLQRNEYHH